MGPGPHPAKRSALPRWAAARRAGWAPARGVSRAPAGGPNTPDELVAGFVVAPQLGERAGPEDHVSPRRILVSHRFSTVRNSDRILVIENGWIVEQGSHDQLLAAGGRYAAMFTAQATATAERISA